MHARETALTQLIESQIFSTIHSFKQLLTQHEEPDFLVFANKEDTPKHIPTLVAAVECSRVLLAGTGPFNKPFPNMRRMRPSSSALLSFKGSLLSSSSFLLLSISTPLVIATPRLDPRKVAPVILEELVGVCSSRLETCPDMEISTTEVDTVFLAFQQMWWNRQDRNYVLQKVMSLRLYIMTHAEKTFRACNLNIISTLWNLILLRCDDLEYVTAFIEINIQLLHLDQHPSIQGGGKILALTFVPYFTVGRWVEFNQWFGDAIDGNHLSTIRAFSKIYIYLARAREVRLNKLPSSVLDFLKLRTELLLKGIEKFIHDPEITCLLVTHLALMLGVHSETRWMFRQKDGMQCVVGVMLEHDKSESINLYCSQILNNVVEGILKRKLRIFRRREATYAAIMRALCYFIHCDDLVSSICNFIRKVLELNPDDVGFLTSVDAIPAISLVKDWYEDDAAIQSVSHQILMLFDSTMRTHMPKKGKKTSRKSKDFRSTCLKKGTSER